MNATSAPRIAERKGRDLAAECIATWFGLGHAPVAPGTWGSAAALAIAFLAVRAGLQPFHFAIAGILFSPVAIWASGVTAIRAGRKDPGMVVVDEVVGQWITLAGAASGAWYVWLTAFALFRVMDIWKPQPVRRLERLPGGYGIVADDAMAGVYAALVLFAAGRFLGW